MSSQESKQAPKAHGQIAERRLGAPGERCERHQASGEWMRVATALISIPRKGGKMPAPNRNMGTEIRIKITPLPLRLTRKTAQTRYAREKRQASSPVINRLGIMVNAGSPPNALNNGASGQDKIKRPMGAALPWS